jgi:hypothetical protein
MAAMRTILAVAILILPSVAFAEWSITNKDNSSYELKKACGSSNEDWSIAGGVTKKLSIPAGATSCTITMKNGGGSCTVKDGESCTIQSGKISK